MKSFKILFLTFIVALTVMEMVESCSSQSCNTHHHHGRRKRSVEDIVAIGEKVLSRFREDLLNALSPELEGASEEEMTAFKLDLENLSFAARNELKKFLRRHGSGREESNPEELVSEVIKNIENKFENKVWFQRFRNFTGEKLETLVNSYFEQISKIQWNGSLEI